MPTVTEPSLPMAVEDVPFRTWETVEDSFRLHAFHVYYNRSFAGEHHLLKRFVKAILASAQPIRDRQAVLDWYREHRARRRRRDGGATS